MAKALELANEHIEEHQKHVSGLKKHMAEKLRAAIKGVEFNGCDERSLYTVLNVRFPRSDNSDMLLFLLDIDGIACSGGSACSSGSNQGSHVLNALKVNGEMQSIRFSFSRYTTREEIDYAVERLAHHLEPVAVAH